MNVARPKKTWNNGCKMKLEDLSKEQLIERVKYYKKMLALQGEILAGYGDAIDSMPVSIDDFVGDETTDLWEQFQKLEKNPPWKKKKGG